MSRREGECKCVRMQGHLELCSMHRAAMVRSLEREAKAGRLRKGPDPRDAALDLAEEALLNFRLDDGFFHDCPYQNCSRCVAGLAALAAIHALPGRAK